MKYLLKHRMTIISLFLVILLGCFVSKVQDEFFVELYFGKISNPPIRDSIIMLSLFLDFLAFESINSAYVVLRNKNMINFLVNSLKKEFIIILLLVFCFNIPTFIFYSNIAFENIKMILNVSLNMILVLLLFANIVRIINVWINNRIKSAVCFFSCFVIFDAVLSYFNFSKFLGITFDFNYIFAFSEAYSFSNFIIIGIIILNIFISILSVYLMVRKDYLINSNEKVFD